MRNRTRHLALSVVLILIASACSASVSTEPVATAVDAEPTEMPATAIPTEEPEPLAQPEPTEAQAPDVVSELDTEAVEEVDEVDTEAVEEVDEADTAADVGDVAGVADADTGPSRDGVPDGWSLYESEDGGYSILLPSEDRTEQTTEYFLDPSVTMTTISARTEAATFIVSHVKTDADVLTHVAGLAEEMNIVFYLNEEGSFDGFDCRAVRGTQTLGAVGEIPFAATVCHNPVLDGIVQLSVFQGNRRASTPPVRPAELGAFFGSFAPLSS